MEVCPQCQLPRELEAWQCDGCGRVFRTDFAMARTELQTELRKARRNLIGVVILSGAAIAIGMLLAIYRSPFIAISLGVVIVGAAGASIQRVRVLTGHLARLPKPTVRS